MELHYQLKFFSQWRSDAGASFGAATDNAVVRDVCGLPYFPGKTLKGLFRESVEDYINFMDAKHFDEVKVIFGGEAKEGKCHFTDATFSEKEASAILSHKLQKYLYHNITTTAIDEKGIARKNSLRTIEAVVPCTLYGTIYNIPNKESFDLLKNSMGFIKYIGMHRNRGFGRCQVSILEEGGENYD